MRFMIPMIDLLSDGRMGLEFKDNKEVQVMETGVLAALCDCKASGTTGFLSFITSSERDSFRMNMRSTESLEVLCSLYTNVFSVRSFLFVTACLINCLG